MSDELPLQHLLLKPTTKIMLMGSTAEAIVRTLTFLTLGSQKLMKSLKPEALILWMISIIGKKIWRSTRDQKTWKNLRGDV